MNNVVELRPPTAKKTRRSRAPKIRAPNPKRALQFAILELIENGTIKGGSPLHKAFEAHFGAYEVREALQEYYASRRAPKDDPGFSEDVKIWRRLMTGVQE